MALFILLTSFIGCNNVNQPIENKTDLRIDYEYIIDQSFTTEEMSNYIFTHMNSLKSYRRCHDNYCAYISPIAWDYDLLDNINKAFPIECMRYTSDSLYSIHKFDNQYYLFSFYTDTEKGVLVKEDYYFIVPASDNVPKVTDDQVSSLKKGENSLADVVAIYPTADKVYDPWVMYVLTVEPKRPTETGPDPFLSRTTGAIYNTVVYTAEGNWFIIDYKVDKRIYNDDFKKYGEISSENIRDYLIIENVRKIDPLPILEQDLPK